MRDLDQATVRALRIIPHASARDCWQRIALSLVLRKYRNRPERGNSAHRVVGLLVGYAAGDGSQNPDGLLTTAHEPAKPAPGVKACHT